MRILIDVHCHLRQYANSNMSADGDRLCALFRQAGITHATPFSIEACYGGVDLGNRYTLEEVEKHEMLSAMVVAHPHHVASSARWIAEARSNAKIVGVKLHPALGNYDILSAKPGNFGRLRDTNKRASRTSAPRSRESNNSGGTNCASRHRCSRSL